MTKEQFMAMSLPFELNIKCEEDNEIKTLNSSRYGMNDTGEFHYKPILHTLSDLTKPIEHKGEKFVPIEKIGKTIEPNGTFEYGEFGWNCATGGDDYQDYYLEISKDLKFNFWCGSKYEGGYVTLEENIHFDIILKLIEYHFDIAGLIEKGEAIDVNRLSENPYK